MALPKGRRQGKSKNEEGYGEGKASIAFGDDVLLDEDEMATTLLACLEAPDYRPPTLPAVAIELLELAGQTDVEFGDVVQLLEQDSLIAGRILKVVKSVLYAGAADITSLHQALCRLGLSTVRDLVLEISMNMKVFKSPDYADTMNLLRRHATVTAHFSKMICKHTQVDAEYAFMSGLLHDVGIAGTLLALSDRKGSRKTPPDLIAIWPAVDRVHQRAGKLMARHWELSEEVQCVLESHHQVLIKGEPQLMPATLCLADDLAHEFGIGVIPKEGDSVTAMNELEKDCVRSHTSADRSGAKTLKHAREALGLDDAKMKKIRAEAATLIERFE